jgi:hypothetical protein
MRDLMSNIQVRRAISPAASLLDNTPIVSQVIDRQGFFSLGFAILIGAVPDADATYTVLVEHGDAANLSDAAAVPDAELIGSDPNSVTAPEAQAGFTFASDDQVRKIGYRGSRRYVRLTITPAANTGATLIAAVALLGNAEVKPVVQPAA